MDQTKPGAPAAANIVMLGLKLAWDTIRSRDVSYLRHYQRRDQDTVI